MFDEIPHSDKESDMLEDTYILIPFGAQLFKNMESGFDGQIRPGIQCTKRQMQLKFI